MRQVEAFTGVQVVTYCLMTNHVHLLLRVPQRQELTDPEILARLEKVSSPAAFAQFMDLWNRMLEQKSEAGLQELRQSVLKRMFDISFFMKELKQRFTQWYNRRAKRNGTLWQDRFKSTLIVK
jgi:REP element-mobilizing transposase RayT